MIASSLIIAPIPSGSVKRWLNDISFKIGFRVFMRSFSSVIRFHNEHFKPKRGGVCVANHTTPMDVVVMSTENSFSLVSFNQTFLFHL